MKCFVATLCILFQLAAGASAQDTPAKNANGETKKNATGKETPKRNSPFKTNREKVSYGFGLNIGRNIASSFQKDGLDVDFDILMKGLVDAFKKAEPKVSEEEINEAMTAFQTEMRAKKAADRKQQVAKNKQEAIAFLTKNAKVKGVVTTKSGLQYTVIKQGKGASPTKKDTVKTHYRGTLLDGTEFDSSYKRKQPAEFPVNGVITGWTEALQLMNVGAKYRLFVPAELAYGDNPREGSPIGPSAMLIFEVELLEIVK